LLAEANYLLLNIAGRKLLVRTMIRYCELFDVAAAE